VLRQLHITGLGVIEDLDLEPPPGLTVLTGETGAGKTMVAIALSLAAGARANAQLVRAGSAAKIQARFDAPTGADEWAEDGEVILARTLSAEGKSGARIGGQLTTASALADLGSLLVEIHGQHQSLRLLEPDTQTAFLDRYAGTEHLEALAAYRETYAELRQLRTSYGRLQDAARDRERELDLLAYQVREIETVAPASGETEDLQAEADQLGHVERLLELAAGAEDALGGEGASAEGLATVARDLASAAEIDAGATELAHRAAALAAEAAELGHDVRGYREALTVDPERLELVRARIAALRGLQRKYGATDADVLAFLAEAAGRLVDLSRADERLEELRGQLEQLERLAERRAAAVSEGRVAAAPRLAGALCAELRELGMEGAALEVAVEQLPAPGPSGIERAGLRFRGGPGQPWLPLAKTASGGELSRVMLACRSVLADLDDVPTLVFDEVDAGIGGEAGLAVGRRLALLAATRQVLVVTHLPQIACFADLHVRVRKSAGTAAAEVLDEHERVRELTRMLAGLESSEHGASHAEELLAEAARTRAASV
jgi:DNA repair protein RecN (Recombination protein N)